MPFWVFLLTALLTLAPAKGNDAEKAAKRAISQCERELRLAGLPPKPLALTVWNYSGRTFDAANYLEFHTYGSSYSIRTGGTADIGGSFKPGPATYSRDLRYRPYVRVNPARAEVNSGSQGATLLDRNQDFSLDVMQRTGYINATLRAAQALVPAQINPNQMTFFEATTERSGAELLAHFGVIPPFAREDALHKGIIDYLNQFDTGRPDVTPHEKINGTSYQLKEGTLWLISGQPLGKPLPIYLENANLERPISRIEFPFLWEIGRAAQISTNAFNETARAGLYFATRELILLGGKLDDAYIFGHSLNERLGKVYRRRYQMKDYSGYKDSPEEMAHVSPLKDALKVVDISPVNGAVKDLVDAAGGQLPVVEALRLWLFAQQSRTEFLDSAGEPDNVVELRDFSPLSAYVVRQEANKISQLAGEKGDTAVHWIGARSPKVEYRDSIVKFAEESSYPYVISIQARQVKRRNTNTQQMETVFQEMDDYFREFNAIEVTSQGKLTPEQLLVVAYHRAVEKLKEQGELNPKQKLIDLGVRFGLVNELASGSTGDRWHLDRDRTVTLNGSMWFGGPTTLREGIHRSAAVYSVEAVARLAEASDIKAGKYVRGVAHLTQYFSNPDLLGF